jgi:hypothetical protein
MKPITTGDIVTPKQTTRAFIKGNQYKVTRTHGSVFYIKDELGFSKQCYPSDFINLSKEPLFVRICNFVNKILGIC